MSKSSRINLYDSSNFSQLFEIKNELDKVSFISNGETEINASAIKFIKKDSQGNVVSEVVDVVSFINNLDLRLNNMSLKIDSVFPNPSPVVVSNLITPINLTTNTSDPNFIVERSSIIFNSASYESYLMFDNNPNTWWACAVGNYDLTTLQAIGPDSFNGIHGSWFKITLDTPRTWNQYQIQPTYREELPSSWRIYGSNDDASYNLITSVDDETFPSFTNQNNLTVSFNINQVSFKYLVFHVTKIINEGSGRDYFTIKEFRFNKI